MPSDTFFGPDPTVAEATLSDVFTNNRSADVSGDVWFDVISDSPRDIAWDILNKAFQDIAWDILNETNQNTAWDILNATALNIAWDILNGPTTDFSWSVFARVLYFIQQFFVKAICFDYNIKAPIQFNKQIVEPLIFTFKPTGTIDVTAYLQGEVFDTININSPTTFDFQIKEPVQFTFGIEHVLEGESVEYPG